MPDNVSILDKLKTFLLDSAVPAVILIVVGVLVIRALMAIVTKALERSKLEKAAHSLIKSLANVVLYIILGLMVASSLGIDVSSIVALASVLTLAISLSVQELLTNVLGGFTLMTTKPFHSGDYVEIAGQSGTVLEIGMTYTKLSTPDNKIVSIPNSAVTTAQIVNYTVSGTRRVDITISASYDSPMDTVLDCLVEAARVPTILPDREPAVAVAEYGESAIVYSLKVWSTTDDYWPTMFAINKRIKEVFDANGVEMTYPHLNVHLDK